MGHIPRKGAGGARGVAARRLDLEHIRPEVGQQARTGRAGNALRQLQDAEVGERLHASTITDTFGMTSRPDQVILSVSEGSRRRVTADAEILRSRSG